MWSFLLKVNLSFIEQVMSELFNTSSNSQYVYCFCFPSTGIGRFQKRLFCKWSSWNSGESSDKNLKRKLVACFCYSGPAHTSFYIWVDALETCLADGWCTVFCFTLLFLLLSEIWDTVFLARLPGWARCATHPHPICSARSVFLITALASLPTPPSCPSRQC